MNRLGSEKSPYLLQHKDNPVWWYAWGDAAFEAAAKQDKPVFLSVGYSTCHWCHVMEHESFEDAEVAALLNSEFIAIKVDREERPDVDDLYMNAVSGLTGRGGWPMSVWLTPAGRPFFGGTYYPKQAFLELLRRLASAWKNERARITEVAGHLAQALAEQERLEAGGSLGNEVFDSYLASFTSGFDARHGGRAGAPKFPPAYDLALLLRLARRPDGARALAMTRTTLDAMARGGIYDHLGGGFARYATDERWLVPHFEKMLYDQASLAAAYTEAWQVTAEPEYRLVAREILDYVLRDLTDPRGGFESAEDADSEGEEGKFYVWTETELRAALPAAEFTPFASAFGVTPAGNFEKRTNILNLQAGSSRATRPPAVASAMKALFALRSRRVRPHKDDKVLASWNGLMISAMARAAVAFDEPRYLEGARRAASFCLGELVRPDGGLLARWRDGEARFAGTLDDYAFLAHGLVDLYQADFDPRWLEAAVKLQERQERLFADRESGGYFFTDGSDPRLLTRGRRIFDNVTPAGASVSVLNLLRLADLAERDDWRERAGAVLASVSGFVRRAPGQFPQLLMALDYARGDAKAVAVIGPAGDALRKDLLAAVRSGFRPRQVVAAGAPGSSGPALLKQKGLLAGRAAAYVCERGVCREPTSDPARVRALLDAPGGADRGPASSGGTGKAGLESS
jgi:uncharacterized protein YyaL (SSP411 family)